MLARQRLREGSAATNASDPCLDDTHTLVAVERRRGDHSNTQTPATKHTSTHGLTSYIFSTLRLIALFWVLSSAGLLSPLSIFLIGLSSVLRLSFSLLLLFQIGEHIRFWIISGMSLTMRCSPQPLRRAVDRFMKLDCHYSIRGSDSAVVVELSR